MPDFSFRKGERLSSKKSISTLFQTGKSIISYPLRFIYNQEPDNNYPALVAVSVPKRLYKKAVDRNLIKRRIREAYRLNKPAFYLLLNERNIKVNLVIQYQAREIMEYKTIQSGLEKGMQKVMQKIGEELENQISE